MIENNSIINGDCRDVLKKIDDNSIDMILTSPPYDDLRDYNGTLEWNFDIFKERVLSCFTFTFMSKTIICR